MKISNVSKHTDGCYFYLFLVMTNFVNYIIIPDYIFPSKPFTTGTEENENQHISKFTSLIKIGRTGMHLFQ